MEPRPQLKRRDVMKKEGRIAKAYRLHQEGLKVKEIATKMKLNEWVVRAYIWRAENPEKYKALLKRYHEKKKARLSVQPSANQPENSTEKKT
jgi:hypothetical protein